jgi:hypothetical protein
MNLAVVGKRALFLNRSVLSDKDKEDFLEILVVPKVLFEPSVATMQQKYKLRKKESQAFINFCLPCRPGNCGNPG